MQKIQTYNSPLGNLTLVSNGIALTGIWFEKQKPLQHILNLPHKVCNLPIFDDTKRWLDIYFEGDVPNFTPLLCPEGTHFRQQVWNYLLQIPYGKTTTYGALAKKMAEHLQKQKMSAQAIGGAVGHNPIPIENIASEQCSFVSACSCSDFHLHVFVIFWIFRNK